MHAPGLHANLFRKHFEVTTGRDIAKVGFTQFLGSMGFEAADYFFKGSQSLKLWVHPDVWISFDKLYLMEDDTTRFRACLHPQMMQFSFGVTAEKLKIERISLEYVIERLLDGLDKEILGGSGETDRSDNHEEDQEGFR